MPDQEASPDPLFSLTKAYPFFARTERRRKLADRLDKILGLAGLSAMVASIRVGDPNPYQAACDYLDVHIEGRREFERLIPKSGPTIVVANHPLGALDALILSGLTLDSRPDSLVFGNAVLIHPVQEKWFLALETIDESPAARRSNLKSMKSALVHLKAGGCVVLFPAGEVERWRWSRLKVEEGAWTHHLARLGAEIGGHCFPCWLSQ